MLLMAHCPAKSNGPGARHEGPGRQLEPGSSQLPFLHALLVSAVQLGMVSMLLKHEELVMLLTTDRCVMLLAPVGELTGPDAAVQPLGSHSLPSLPVSHLELGSSFTSPSFTTRPSCRLVPVLPVALLLGHAAL